jgi:superfamily II DNA or RNA helicase
MFIHDTEAIPGVGIESYSLSSTRAPSYLLRLIGKVAVEEKTKYIIIKGVPVNAIIAAMQRHWNTTIIARNIFVDVNSSYIKIYKFFALEIYYIFSTLISDRSLPPGYRAVVGEAKLQLEKNTWIKDIWNTQKDIFNVDRLSDYKKSPLPSQSKFFEVYSQRTQQMGLNGYLLTSPPGSGKTLSSLMLMSGLKKDLVIIICLKVALSRPWQLTLDTEFNSTKKVWSTLTENTITHTDYDYIVVHYEAINKLDGIIDQLKKKNVGIILDESHNFNDPKSERTQNYLKLAEMIGCKDVLPMSGTPVKAMAAETIPTLRAIDPLFIPEVEISFKKIFGVSTARANDIMCRRIGMISYTIPKSEVVDNGLSEINYKVTFPGSEKYTLTNLKEEMRVFITERLKFYKDNLPSITGEYNDIVKQFSLSVKGTNEKGLLKQYIDDIDTITSSTDLRIINDIIQRANAYERKVIQPTLSGATLKKFKDSKSVVKYVGLKVRGEALGRILGKRRSECHVDMVKHAKIENFVLDARKKTLIFTSYVPVVKELTAYFKAGELGKKFNPIPVYQETSKNLPKLVDDFYNVEKDNPIIATYNTLSTAIPLTAASTVILFNQPFRSYEREQSIARADRKEQDGPVIVVNVILDTDGEPNISTRSEDIMKWSKEQVEQITGVKISNDDIQTVGLEEFIDDQELSFMTMPESNKTIDEYQADVMSLVSSNESFTEQVFLNDVVPSMEGIFDTASNKVKQLFRTFSTNAIDKERVGVFYPSKQFYNIINNTTYDVLADLYVMRPEGLKSTYIEFAEELAMQFSGLAVFFDKALAPVNQYLATLASDPGQIGSVRPGEFNLYLKAYDLSSARASYASHFKAGETVTARYHQMINKNDDWQVLQIKLNDVQSAYLKISPEKVEESVNTSYDILEDIVRRLKADEQLRKLSKIQIRDLSTLAYSLASAVEFYSVLMFIWRVFNQSLKETDKNIVEASKRDFDKKVA